MKYPVTLVLKDSSGTIVGAQTCNYSWDVERMLELAEVGETIQIVAARTKEPEPAQPPENTDALIKADADSEVAF